MQHQSYRNDKPNSTSATICINVWHDFLSPFMSLFSGETEKIVLKLRPTSFKNKFNFTFQIVLDPYNFMVLQFVPIEQL